MTAPGTSFPVEQVDYPCSQEEAATADYWHFHRGSLNPANCDFVYYRRVGWPRSALGPTDPSLIRWTDTGDASDILAWHPVFSTSQRAHRLRDADQHRAMREALRAVADAMCLNENGEIGDYGWSITKLNRARPMIRAALTESPQS